MTDASRRSACAGVTLVELMVAMVVLLIATLATLASELTSLNLTKSSRASNIAMADLSATMEKMLSDPANQIPITYPPGTPLAAYANPNLNNGSIIVNYPGYVAGSTVPDPLEINLVMTYTDYVGRQKSLRLSSMKTQ